MGIKLQKPLSKIQRFLEDHTIVQSLPPFGITFLQQTSMTGNRELLLKEQVFDTYTDAYEFSAFLEERSHDDKRCMYLVQLQKYFMEGNEERGGEGYSVYGLYDFPHRTLEHEKVERMGKGIRFGESELWSIMMSCVAALSHMEGMKRRHLNLSSSTITLDDEGVIRLYDPLLVKNHPNYSQLLAHKFTNNTYICPELCQSLSQKIKHPPIDPYLSDIFVLGMIILEIGLMQYLNECYSQTYQLFDHSALQQKIQRFSELYSDHLTSIILEMTKPIHLRSSYRRVLHLIRKYEPHESKYSSYRELSNQYETPKRSRNGDTSRRSMELEESPGEKLHGSEKIFGFQGIRGVTFGSSEIKETKKGDGDRITKGRG